MAIVQSPSQAAIFLKIGLNFDQKIKALTCKAYISLAMQVQARTQAQVQGKNIKNARQREAQAQEWKHLCLRSRWRRSKYFFLALAMLVKTMLSLKRI